MVWRARKARSTRGYPSEPHSAGCASSDSGPGRTSRIEACPASARCNARVAFRSAQESHDFDMKQNDAQVDAFTRTPVRDETARAECQQSLVSMSDASIRHCAQCALQTAEPQNIRGAKHGSSRTGRAVTDGQAEHRERLGVAASRRAQCITMIEAMRALRLSSRRRGVFVLVAVSGLLRVDMLVDVRCQCFFEWTR